MDEQNGVMVLTYGSEKIFIETNNFSDDSEFTDTSISSAESDYEEIEVNSPLDTTLTPLRLDATLPSDATLPLDTMLPSKSTKQCCDSKLPNPYINLVRCDHLVTEMLSKRYTSIDDSIQTRKPNKGTYSLRSRRPILDYRLIGRLISIPESSRKAKRKVKLKVKRNISKNVYRQPKSSKKAKTKVSKNTVKSRLSTKVRWSNGMFLKQTEEGENALYADCDRNSIPRTNVFSHNIRNCFPAFSENIKFEFCNEDGFQNASNGFANSVNSFSTLDSTNPLPSIVIKSEPIDEYFEKTTECHFNQLDSTEMTNNSFYSVKNKEITDTFIHRKMNHKVALPEYSVGVKIEPEFKQAFIDTAEEYYMRKMKKENHVDSSDSEVDVEKAWDGPVFIVDPETVAFDHPYSSPLNVGHDKTQKAKPSAKVDSHGKINRRSSSLVSNYIIKAPILLKLVDGTVVAKPASSEKREVAKPASSEKIEVAKPESSEKREIPRSLNHNMLERMRRKSLAGSYKELRDAIPELRSDDKMSKITILTTACRYIKSLERMENKLENTLRLLNERKDKLTKIRESRVSNDAIHDKVFT